MSKGSNRKQRKINRARKMQVLASDLNRTPYRSRLDQSDSTSPKSAPDSTTNLPAYSTDYLVDYCYRHIAQWASDARAEVKRMDASDGHMVGRPPSADVSKAKSNVCALAAKLSKVMLKKVL